MLVRWFIYFYRSRRERSQSATVNVLPPAVALVNNYVNEKLPLHPNNEQAEVDGNHPSRWARIYDRITYPYYVYDDPWTNTSYGIRRFLPNNNNTIMNEKPINKNPRSNIPIRTVGQ